jgi:cell division inhibitor SepF
MLARRSESGVPRLRLLPERQRVQLASPQQFNDARHIADSVKGGASVIVNLADADTALDGRLGDFALGLAAGLGGTVGRAGQRLMVVAPPGVALSGGDSLEDATG